jgi:hypothetical protein
MQKAILSEIFPDPLKFSILKPLYKKVDEMKQQFGFMKHLVTEDAIYKLTDNMLNSLNNRNVVGRIF